MRPLLTPSKYNKTQGIGGPALAALTVAGTVGVLALTGLANRYCSARAEKANPPKGSFIEIDGVRLHYVSVGEGAAIVFLHGNGSMVEDWLCSGILSSLRDHRTVVFDRPGYGHSPRPKSAIRTPEAQADLIAKALTFLGVDRTIVVGHSWGTLVAVRLAERHPDRVTGLVLLSGYYFAQPRLDVLMASIGALPVLGPVLSHTILPIISRLTWPLSLRNLFGPNEVPEKFAAFPKALAVRPSHIRTSAEEAALMLPSTAGLVPACQKLVLPVAIVCGSGDRVVDHTQSAKLHGRLPGSTLRTVSDGHMVHQTALSQVIEAIRSVDGN